MAVQILNDMPDAAVHRGDPQPRAAVAELSDWSPRATRATTRKNRPLFFAITLAVHAVAVLGFMSIRHVTRMEQAPAPIVAEILQAPQSEREIVPLAPPPLQDVVYALPAPEVVAIDVESLAPPPSTAIAANSAQAAQAVVPPLVEAVEYVRPPAPVYPRESARRREYGTVVLRVLVDPNGRAAQIQVERSSGHQRLDMAAREAVEGARFRPYEVNGIRQAAQVLIPIEFTRRAT
jgi:protein TonB